MIIKDYTVARLEETDEIKETIIELYIDDNGNSCKRSYIPIFREGVVLRRCIGKLLNGDQIMFWKEEKC